MTRPIRVGTIVPSSNVTAQEPLEWVDRQSENCAARLADARCDGRAYAGLIGSMARWPGYHRESASTLEALEANRIALVAPAIEELAQPVIGCLEETVASD